MEFENAPFREFDADDKMELDSLESQFPTPVSSPSDGGEMGQDKDLTDVPASPVRDIWPADSLLKPEHFTIDKQKCCACKADLGWALPMNRIPKEHYLYCGGDLTSKNPLYTSPCYDQAVIQCMACEKHFVKTKAHYVHRPGNCAYTTPTAIYGLMCGDCYEDQMKLEPGYEETKAKMKAYREMRASLEEKDKDIANLANMPSNTQPAHYKNIYPNPYPHQPQAAAAAIPIEPLPTPATKRKRTDHDRIENYEFEQPF